MRFALLTVVASLVFAASASAETVPGQLIVQFGPSASANERASAHRAAGATVEDTITAINAVVVRVPAGREAVAIRAYKAAPGVRNAEQDVVVNATGPILPNDPAFKNQWALNNADEWKTSNPGGTVHVGDKLFQPDADVDAPEAWAIKNATPVKVAVLDTGVDRDHQDLPRPIGEKNFTTSKTLDDLYGHGTHVYGTIAAIRNNGIGVAGEAGDLVSDGSTIQTVQMYSGKVLGDNGSGSCSSVANGITWAADQGAKIISLSLGGGYCNAELAAVNYATGVTSPGKDSLIVAAAGNSSTDQLTNAYPAAFSVSPTPNAQVLAVAATDDSDRIASFSNFGSWVGIAAPGVDIYATLPNHTNRIGTKNYGYLSGTSMATPIVSGAAALVAGALADGTYGAVNGRANDDLRSRLLATVDKQGEISSAKLPNAGRVNACRAVDPTGCPPPQP